MNYTVAIHKNNSTHYTVTVPDLDNCISTGDTLDQALESAREAIYHHLAELAESKIFAPTATPIDEHIKHPPHKDTIWAFIDIDISAFLGKTEKATVTLPKLLINKIDTIVAEGIAKSRSAFLAESAIKALSTRTDTHH